ncbi:MAG: TIM barrel protein [Gammaproteobacteria bacterium]|jgi:D-psicose/D-tagatose/L-ribulose 3-epimerase|nr:TIM barrel protein [Gammaproteobacteria bacterium]
MSIKIGMNMLLWGTHITPRDIPVFAALAACGYDGVEIPVAEQSEQELLQMARACDELGLARTASAFVGEQANPISAQPGIRAAAVENLKRSIDGAALLGADILIGGIYQAHKYFTGAGATEKEWQWCADYLRTCGEYAQTQGITLGLEVLNRFEVFLINTVADCARMVEQVGLDNVGIHYDTHHANIEEPAPGVALARAAPALKHIHLSESHRGTLGTGQVDWAATFEALRKINYSGWLVIEAFGTTDQNLASAANVWRNAFTSREEVYEHGITFIRTNL